MQILRKFGFGFISAGGFDVAKLARLKFTSEVVGIAPVALVADPNPATAKRPNAAMAAIRDLGMPLIRNLFILSLPDGLGYPYSKIGAK